MSPATTGLAQSVHTRLITHAKHLGLDPNHLLSRYAVERYLYRLSRSPHAERFVLKGALLLLAWLGETSRPTRDADLLGLGDLGPEVLAALFEEVCAVDVEPDAMSYDPASVQVSAIRQDEAHGGQRVILQARLGNARLGVQVDVGLGDVVTPAPTWLEYPSLLDLPRPRLRAYAPETAIAEKFHAMVKLGSNNSRMRDFFDLFVLQAAMNFQGDRLMQALRATFLQRNTSLPPQRPLALTSDFADLAAQRWRAFVSKSVVRSAPQELHAVIPVLQRFLWPVVEAARDGVRFTSSWAAGGPWSGA